MIIVPARIDSKENRSSGNLSKVLCVKTNTRSSTSSGILKMPLRSAAINLRRRWKRVFPVRNSLFPILALLVVVIHAFWMSYDITITSHERHRPKRKRTQLTESSPLSPFYPPSPGIEYAGFSRAFPLWGNDFPCGQLEDEYIMRTRLPATEGLFYVKGAEISSALLSGITAQIARNMGRRRQQQEHGNGAADPIANDVHKNATTNVCTARLASQRARRYYDRTPNKSFLWSVVREPVDRLVSKYYHYGHVEAVKTRRRRSTLSKFQTYLFNSESQDYGYYFKSLAVYRKLDPYTKEHERHTQELLESYDFLGVSERMDESLAVLKIILNLDIQDVLYIPFENAGAGSTNKTISATVDYYQNWRKDECRAIPKSDVTLEMKEWFHGEEFEAFIEGDVLFYKAVNASLDKTIDKLGRDLVDKTVEQLRLAQKVVEEECQNIRFPCSSEGVFQKENDCLFSDIGCGFSCLDELGEKISRDPRFQTVVK
jgi:hypothetical protein